MSNKYELITKINYYSAEDNNKELLNILNELFYNKEYKSFLQEVFVIISITEMYGFLAYLSRDEIVCFLNWDFYKSQTYKGQSIEYYNKGQLSLIYDLEKNKKVFLSAPTSFGKTSIVLEYIINNQKSLNNILFVVPTNSLLEELFQKITYINKALKMNYSITTQPRFNNNVRNILLLTPERFFLASENFNINVFSLVIMDETYQIVDSKNEMISDFLESRALRFRKVADMIGKSNNQTIFLSPFTYELTESMHKFLTKYDIKKIDRKIEYVGREIINISNSDDFQKIFGKAKGYTKNLSKAKKTKYILDKLSKQKNIVYVSNYAEAYKIVDEIDWPIENSHNDRFNMFIRHLESNYALKNRYERKIVSALKKGIGIYVAPLPRYIKKEIVKLYEEDELKTLIITTAFTEGVNTSASNLIFTSLISGPTVNKLSDIDILNVSGRAGRFAKSSIGKIYCIDKTIYDKVSQLQKEGSIKLENYNYMQGNPEIKRDDYSIEMIDNEFLTDEEKETKKEIKNEKLRLGLTSKELNIALCVPTKRKLVLYSAVDLENIDELYKACANILTNEANKRIESLDTLFNFIKVTFYKQNINPFLIKPYEIKPFDKSGKFTWGRLYKIYCSGKSKDIINNNISFISKEFDSIYSKLTQKYHEKSDVENAFKEQDKGWVLKYYNKNLGLNYDAFFTETFKFINSVVQYKIPFYISFITSIVKLFIKKNMIDNRYNISKLDSKKIVSLFENGNFNDSYENLIDYGISNDVILKISENNISIEEVLGMSFKQDIFDEYELLTLSEFSNLMK